MEKRLADLETQVGELSEQVKARPAAPAAPGAPDASEQAAADLLRKASEASEKGEYDEAKQHLAKLLGEYGSTRAARAGARLEGDLKVIGTDAPDLQVEKWYQGEANTDSKAQLLVFWEVWCPHCKREVPKLQATFDKYSPQGLSVIGLTKQSRDVTDDQVQDFVTSNSIAYPVAREQGQSMSDAYNVKGVPSAAVVKEGKVVWKGHPARLTDAMIEGWL
jgi:peroxiredoxin